jgi:fructokinase
MSADEPLVAGIELGGTKCIALLARGRTIVRRARWATAAPAEILPAMRAQLQAWFAETPFAAIGIAVFGPVDLHPASPGFGRILTTPKPGWAGADARGAFADHFDVPIGFETDVGAAALAEARWGGSIGCDTHAYITIGTGIGVGIVAGGRVVHGTLHPEMGHIRVRRDPADTFAGVCGFHGDCLAGIASGPAIAARLDAAADDGHRALVWARVADEIAELVAVLILTLSPERIVFGGGVAIGHPGLVEAIRVRSLALLGGFPHGWSAATLASTVILSPLGEEAGPLGAIAVGLESSGSGRQP